MTYVATEVCINCKYMVCLKVCSVDMILQNSEGGLDTWLELNASCARTWPNIATKGVPPDNANRWYGAVNKSEHLSPEAGRQT